MEGTEYTIASPGKRILAYIVDSMFMSIASIIILFLIGQGDGLSAIANYSGADIEQIIEKVLPIVQTLTFIQLALGVLYFGMFQAMSNVRNCFIFALYVLMDQNFPLSIPFSDIL